MELAQQVSERALALRASPAPLRRAPAAGDWEQDGYVVHYSWTADSAQKLEKIERFGFNYLPDDRLRRMVES